MVGCLESPFPKYFNLGIYRGFKWHSKPTGFLTHGKLHRWFSNLSFFMNHWRHPAPSERAIPSVSLHFTPEVKCSNHIISPLVSLPGVSLFFQVTLSAGQVHFPKTQLLDVTSAQQLLGLLFAFLSKLHSLSNIVFLFFGFFPFLATLCGMWDLSSLTRDQAHIPCSESEVS